MLNKGQIVEHSFLNPPQQAPLGDSDARSSTGLRRRAIIQARNLSWNLQRLWGDSLAGFRPAA
jgi:hypothetical protein